MSRRTEAAGGRERYAPADRQLADSLTDTANTIAQFTSEHDHQLSFGDMMALAETEIRIRAYAEILESFSSGFVQTTVSEVFQKLGKLRDEVGQHAKQ